MYAEEQRAEDAGDFLSILCATSLSSAFRLRRGLSQGLDHPDVREATHGGLDECVQGGKVGGSCGLEVMGTIGRILGLVTQHHSSRAWNLRIQRNRCDGLVAMMGFARHVCTKEIPWRSISSNCPQARRLIPRYA
jgi:hypothetical protein